MRWRRRFALPAGKAFISLPLNFLAFQTAPRLRLPMQTQDSELSSNSEMRPLSTRSTTGVKVLWPLPSPSMDARAPFFLDVVSSRI